MSVGLIFNFQGGFMHKPDEVCDCGQNEAWAANIKHMFDVYLQEAVESIKHCRVHFDKVVTDAQQHDNTRQEISIQALQNAVETANMVSKQAVRHSDIAIDRQWNVDEQGYTVNEILRNETFKDGIAAVVVKAVADAMNTQ